MNPGERLHKYTILRELGRGGMGGVYVAEEDITGKQFAIKTLFKRFSEEEAYVRRFQREAQVYRQFEHPHIVRYIESGFDNGSYFIVLEYVKGQTLGEIMYDQGRLEPVPALKIAIALAEALNHAHGRGVVHRDLKPANVLIDESGEVKLLDFGVAHKEDQLVRTQEGTVVGTYYYAAPEQNQGKTEIDRRSDLYTLGIVFYEMLAGRRPFEGDLLEVASDQSRESYLPLEKVVPEIAAFLPAIVHKLMKKEPAERYQDAATLLEELRAGLTALSPRGGGVPVVRPIAAPTPVSHPSFGPTSDIRLGAPGLVNLPNTLQVPQPVSVSGSFPSAAAPPVAPGGSSSVNLAIPPPAAAPLTPAPAPTPEPMGATSQGATGQGENDTRWHAAREAFQKRQLDQAQALCESVLETAPNFALGQAFLGKILSAKGHTYNAIEAFKSALSLSPSDVQMHMDYAMALYTMKLPAKAIEAFNAVLVLDPKNMLAVQYLNLLQQGAQPSQAPVAPAAVPPPQSPALAGAGLYGDVYHPPSSAPAPAAEAGAMNRLESFFNAPAPDLPAAPPASGGVTPPPVSFAPVASPVSMAPVNASPVSMAPPAASPVSMPGVSPVQIPPPGQPSVVGSVAPPVPQGNPSARLTVPPPVSMMGSGTSPVQSPKRTPDYIPPPKPVEDPTAAEDPDSEGDGSRFDDKKNKKKKRQEREDAILVDPDRAWMFGTLWWGLGAAYLGHRGRAFILTIFEVLLLGMALLPLALPEVFLKLQASKVSFVAVANWLYGLGLAPTRGVIYKTISGLDRSVAPAINQLVRGHVADICMGLGALGFLWFEISLPSAFLQEAQYANLAGRVLEVRRDMTLKISLGSDRGVEEGMIFRVEKRKHVDALSQLNFRTLMIAPQVFPIGRARVTSVTPTFAICQFKRLPGQSSSPSSGDRVAIMME